MSMVLTRKDTAVDNVVAWKFSLEVHLPDGRVFSRISYVKRANRLEAAQALLNEYPMATFAMEQSEPLTGRELDEQLAGDSFLQGEVVRCVYFR